MKVRIPVSVGELYDKITILKNKSDLIGDAHKRRNVDRELAMLVRCAKRVDPSYDSDKDFVSLLKVNRSLWDIEDAKRDCERRKDFGEGFVRLARSVYKMNDKRARIKRSINERFGSEIIEEKSYKKY